MMEKVGLLIEYKDGRVKEANFGMATAARGENRELVALVVDAPLGNARQALETYGVGRIVSILTGSGPSAWNPAARAAAVVAAMAEYGIGQLVGLTSPASRDLLPRIAALLEAPLAMDCIEIDLDAHRVKTTQYSGKIIATIALTGSHFVYGMRANVVAPQPDPLPAEVLEFSHEAQNGPDYEILGTRAEAGASQDLPEAEIIISGGRGMKNGENFRLLFDIAGHLGASVGASRVAVDNGWVPYAMQVGQTGAKVNPKVYIAAGISGSVQHYAGMKSAAMIIAINTNAKAPIRANCDYYAIGDLFEILPELAEQLDRHTAP